MNEKNKNLLTRVATAAVVLPVVLYLVWEGGLGFAVLVAIAGAMCGYELWTMSEKRVGAAGVITVLVTALIPVAAWHTSRMSGHLLPEWFGVALASAMIAVFAAVLLEPSGLETAPRPVATAALSWLYVGLLLGTLVGVRARFGWHYILLAFALTFGNDTAAYFAGRFLGRHKLYERVSPKKTWEGFFGGWVGSFFFALVVKWIWAHELSALACFAAALPAGLLSPCGDLSESMLKRAYGVKDSGVFFPGHGGFLDRIDALLFIAPWVYAFARYVHPRLP